MKIYKHSYNEIEEIEVVYENKRNYFQGARDGDELYRIEKKEICRKPNGKDYGYYYDSNIAKEAINIFLKERIKEYTRILDNNKT